MTKKQTSNLITVVLLVAIVLAGVLLYRGYHPNTVKSNTVATTGVTLKFNPPLTAATKVEVDNSNKQQIKTLTLDPSTKGQYNIALNPGVYQLKVSSPTKAFPPLQPMTVTVTQNRLVTEEISMSVGL